MNYLIRRVYVGDHVEVVFGSSESWRKEERALRSTAHAKWIHITRVTEKNACRLACHYGRYVGLYTKSAFLPSHIGCARNLETGKIVEIDFEQK